MKSADELKLLKVELKSLEQKVRLLKKDLRRSKSFHCLVAAYNLYLAEIHSKCVKKTSLQEAKDTSEFINIFIDDPYEKTTPYQFMKSPEDEANKAIVSFQIYKSIIEQLPNDKRVIEGFSNWYINSGWETTMIKCNYQYIEHIAGLLILKDMKRVSENEFHKALGNLKKIRHPFTFNAGLIKRSFVQVMQKFDEIKRKVDIRSKPKPVLKVVYKTYY